MRHFFSLCILLLSFGIEVSFAAPGANGCLNGGGNSNNHHAAYCQALLNQNNNNNQQPAPMATPAPKPTPVGYLTPPQRTPAPPVVAIPTPLPSLTPTPMPIPSVNYAVKVNSKLKRLNKKHVDKLKNKKLIHSDGSLTKAGLKKGIHQIVNQSPSTLVLPHVLIAPPMPKPPLTPPDPVMKVPTPDYSKMGVPLPKLNPGDKVVYYTNVKGTIQAFGSKDLDKIKVKGYINPDGGISGQGAAHGLNFMIVPAPVAAKAPPVPTPYLVPNQNHDNHAIPVPKLPDGATLKYYATNGKTMTPLTPDQVKQLKANKTILPDGGISYTGYGYGIRFMLVPPTPSPQATPSTPVQAVPTPIYQANLIPSLTKTDKPLEPIGKIIEGKVFKLTNFQINKLIESSLVHPDGALKTAALDYGFQFIPSEKEANTTYEELDQNIFDESINLVEKGIPAPVYSRVHEHRFLNLLPEASDHEFEKAIGGKKDGYCWWCWILVLIAIGIGYYTYKRYNNKGEGAA